VDVVVKLILQLRVSNRFALPPEASRAVVLSRNSWSTGIWFIRAGLQGVDQFCHIRVCTIETHRFAVHCVDIDGRASGLVSTAGTMPLRLVLLGLGRRLDCNRIAVLHRIAGVGRDEQRQKAGYLPHQTTVHQLSGESLEGLLA
jgi:hypothetical protein